MIETRAIVVEDRREVRDYWRLRLRVNHFQPERTIQALQLIPKPGQFAMLRPSEQLEPLLRRALVYYRVESSEEATDFEFIYKVLGRGTLRLSMLHRDDEVDLLGPLGNGFTIDPNLPSGSEVAFISGGVGIPAFYTLAQELKSRRINPKLFHGEVTGDVEKGLVGVSDFVDLLGDDHVRCATDDGSVGVKGFVTTAFERYLKSGGATPRVIYSCGPEPMLKRVSELGKELEVPTQLSLEANMGCGFGVCLGCAVKVNTASQRGFSFQRVCMEGPVFRGEDVIWE
jgi:dihydroorotate dehydrogenase electron transfer subunit